MRPARGLKRNIILNIKNLFQEISMTGILTTAHCAIAGLQITLATLEINILGITKTSREDCARTKARLYHLAQEPHELTL